MLTPAEIRREMRSRVAVRRKDLLADFPLDYDASPRFQTTGWTLGGTPAIDTDTRPPVASGPSLASKFWITADVAPPTDLAIWELAALSDPVTSDLLYAVDDPGGTPASRKLTLANLFKLLVSNVTLTVLTGSSTYSPASIVRHVIVMVVGGGGGGAGGINTDSSGGGGGGGGTVVKYLAASAITNGAYVVGGGGAADNAGVDSTFNINGTTILTAGGGQPGTAGATSTTVGTQTAAGAGGTASNGDLNIPGSGGMLGIIFSGTAGSGGRGGSSALGFGGGDPGSNIAGIAGESYGGGGSGGHASGTANRVGQSGAAGTIAILEFHG